MKDRIRETGENIKNTKNFKGYLKFNEKMKCHTSMKVGGKAELFIAPKDTFSLIELLKTSQKNNLPFFILGGGSNLVISDQGFDNLVISTQNFKGIKFTVTQEKEKITLKNQKIIEGKKTFLTCKSGTTIKELNDFCQKHALLGLENFSGLPGTAGGGCFMNARCYEKNICDAIYSVKYIDLENTDNFEEKTLTVEESKDLWDYKMSPFQKKKSFITEVTFNLLSIEKKYASYIKEQNAFYKNDRKQKGHFKYPSAGSVFKNNRSFGKPSGVLVDQAGLKGLKKGGAQVAPWHGNFIINRKNAKASDIYALVEEVKAKVKEQTGFNLECEIIFCGKGY